MINKSVVNADGLLIELWVLEKPDGSFYGYNLPEGCTSVPYINDVLTITNGILHAPLKPHWSFETGAWIDDATAEELAAEYPAQTTAPTPEERIAALEDQNVMLTECVLELSGLLYA